MKQQRIGAWARLLCGLLLMGSGVLGVGCGGLPRRVAYVAAPLTTLPGGVNVQLQWIDAKAGLMRVHLFFSNASGQLMYVHRDGIGLRLGDGHVLQRLGQRHVPYAIPPGQGRNVWVHFAQPGLDMRRLQPASLVIGGVSYVTDPRPRVVGEIPISYAGRAP